MTDIFGATATGQRVRLTEVERRACRAWHIRSIDGPDTSCAAEPTDGESAAGVMVTRGDVEQVLAALDLAIEALGEVDRAVRGKRGIVSAKAANMVQWVLDDFEATHAEAYARVIRDAGLTDYFDGDDDTP